RRGRWWPRPRTPRRRRAARAATRSARRTTAPPRRCRTPSARRSRTDPVLVLLRAVGVRLVHPGRHAAVVAAGVARLVAAGVRAVPADRGRARRDGGGA